MNKRFKSTRCGHLGRHSGSSSSSSSRRFIEQRATARRPPLFGASGLFGFGSPVTRSSFPTFRRRPVHVWVPPTRHRLRSAPSQTNGTTVVFFLSQQRPIGCKSNLRDKKNPHHHNNRETHVRRRDTRRPLTFCWARHMLHFQL